MSFTKIVGRKIGRGVLFLLIAFGAAGFLGTQVPGGFIPEEDQGYFYINIQGPNASSIQRTDEVARKVETFLMEQPEVEYVTNVTGFSLLTSAFSPSNGFMFVSLKNWDDREATALEVVRRLNAQLMRIPEAQVNGFGPPAIPGLGNGGGFSIMIQDKSGNPPEYLFENTMAFVQAANARPEIGAAFSQFQAQVPQREIIINRDKILKAGVDLNSVYETFGAFLGGSYVNDFNRFGRLYKAYIQAEPEYRRDASGLDLFYVKNRDGQSVPISTFVQVEPTSGPDYTNRFNLYRSAEVMGGPAPGYTSAQALTALEEVARATLPSDMTFAWNAMSYQEKAASGTVGVVFAFSLVLVFLILAAQYESWSLPLSILLGTPFALLGSFLFLYLARLFSTSYELNVFAQISLVMLIAMAAKNAILIVEFANIKFQEGMSLYDAAMDAAKLRFRPILMTVFSFILGVFPLILASGSGAEARKVMGMALLGGVGIATLIGVFMYPMMFVMVGKLFKYEEKRAALQAKTEDE